MERSLSLRLKQEQYPRDGNTPQQATFCVETGDQNIRGESPISFPKTFLKMYNYSFSPIDNDQNLGKCLSLFTTLKWPNPQISTTWHPTKSTKDFTLSVLKKQTK